MPPKINSSIVESGEAVYPENWPSPPAGFELTEKTRFSDGEQEFIYESDLVDFRISSHEHLYSTTVRVGNEYIDYRIETEDKVINWLNNLFEMYNDSVAFQIHTSESGDVLRCVDKTAEIRTLSDTSLNSEEKLTHLDSYKKWVIHNPQTIGDLRLIVRFNDTGIYKYVFENHVLDIYTSETKSTLDAYPIPNTQIVYEYLSERYESPDCTFLYIDDSVRNVDLIKEFI